MLQSGLSRDHAERCRAACQALDAPLQGLKQGKKKDELEAILAADKIGCGAPHRWNRNVNLAQGRDPASADQSS
jgi:hypothetical protein